MTVKGRVLRMSLRAFPEPLDRAVRVPSSPPCQATVTLSVLTICSSSIIECFPWARIVPVAGNTRTSKRRSSESGRDRWENVRIWYTVMPPRKRSHCRRISGRDCIEQPGKSSERGGTWVGFCGFSGGLPGKQGGGGTSRHHGEYRKLHVVWLY